MIFAAAVTAVLAGVLTPLLAKWAHRRDYLDVPNHRSSHVVATPRIGGVALIAGVLAGAAMLPAAAAGRDVMLVLAGAVAIGVLGLVDDFRHLSALTRLVVQTALAAGVVAAVGPVALPWLAPGSTAAAVVTVLWIVTLTNAYNFMDGIDGIAGAQAIVAGLGWTAVGVLAGAPQAAALGLLLAAASSGFLLHNWHPARVFMGDAGSGFFGFLFAALPLLAPRGSGPMFWCALLLMWPFLFDAGFTLLRRASRGENVLSAHRTHIYQRLVLTGLSHSQVALIYAGLALLGAAGAVAVETGQPVAPLASAAAVLSAGAALWWSLTVREAASVRPPRRAAV